jgi:hypothetical protein
VGIHCCGEFDRQYNHGASGATLGLLSVSVLFTVSQNRAPETQSLVIELEALESVLYQLETSYGPVMPMQATAVTCVDLLQTSLQRP